ncbi:MAG TPA: EAL domain-containing protein [Rhodocyclaceae bacterium]|nr:EAL domain-containing protein [Rhodocyclaceae bacterium]
MNTSLFDSLACIVLRLDAQLNIWFMNSYGLKRLGYERLGQVFGKPLRSLMPNEHAGSDALEATLAGVRKIGVGSHIGSMLRKDDGQTLSMCWSLEFRTNPEEQIAPFLLIGLDITPLVLEEQANALFRSVAMHLEYSFVITNEELRIVYANPATSKVSGYSDRELLGQTPAIFKSGETPAEFYRDCWATLSSGGIWHGEFINRRKNGELYREIKTIFAIRNGDGVIRNYLSIGADSSAEKRYSQSINQSAATDPLTGLPNQTAFLRSLVAALNEAQQRSQEISVLHINIDDFSGLSAEFGADNAEKMLLETSRRVQAVLRQSDSIAYLGNDRFAVLLRPSGTVAKAYADEVAHRILAAIRDPFTIVDVSTGITASIGIASFPQDGVSSHELYRHAIDATQAARAGGGDDWRRFKPEIAIPRKSRRKFLDDIHQALTQNELTLYYQPQLSLLTGEIIGLEALIRWNHPLRGLVMPAEFIPLAEQTGQIIAIGEWTLATACRQMRAWLNAGIPPLKVAVNLSARHFKRSDLHSTISALLGVQRVSPGFLEIEITESAMLQDMAATIHITNQLKKLGVRLSLDDFGTGYSSLAYLSRLPIDVVKIDQSFIHDITTNPTNAAIATATIAISHRLGKTVLAEGVETEEQMLYLRRNGCDEMQGYLFSPPCDADAVTGMLLRGAELKFPAQEDEDTRNTLLIVDDEVSILSALKRMLRHEGYEVLTAGSATEGLALLSKHRVQVIVSDQRMPEMSGSEFLSRVRVIYPETIRIMLSGFSDISAITDSINKGAIYRYLSKPWNDAELKSEIHGAFRQWRETFGSRRP